MRKYQLSENDNGCPDISNCDLIMGDSDAAVYYDGDHGAFYMINRICGDIISAVEISKKADKYAYALACMLSGISGNEVLS